MTVAKNCAIQLHERFGSNKLKQVSIYPNLFILFQVALVLQISSALRERSFSVI